MRHFVLCSNVRLLFEVVYAVRERAFIAKLASAGLLEVPAELCFTFGLVPTIAFLLAIERVFLVDFFDF